MQIKGTIDQERGKGRGGPACGTGGRFISQYPKRIVPYLRLPLGCLHAWFRYE